MHIGITFDVKSEKGHGPGASDDEQEEFDCPATIEAIAAVFRSLGHEVDLLGDGRDCLEHLLHRAPEFVFNFAEGVGVGRSREARVPAVLEMLGIPYSGSDPLTLAVTLDKDCARRLVCSAGVAVPAGFVVGTEDDPQEAVADRPIPFPVIVKPAWEGSSKGIRARCLVERSRPELIEVIDYLRREQRQPVLVEEYIDGDELTVGLVGNGPPQIIGVMRVLPAQPSSRFVYSLEVKRDFRRQVRYECPARLPSGETQALERAALEAYRILGCRDVARVDFRLRQGVPYFLEVNPLPGLNPESSDLVILAELAGMSYQSLVAAILQAALERHALPARTPA